MAHAHQLQAIAKAVEGANRIYLTAHGHIAIVGQAALRARSPTYRILAAHTAMPGYTPGTDGAAGTIKQIRGVRDKRAQVCAETFVIRRRVGSGALLFSL